MPCDKLRMIRFFVDVHCFSQSTRAYLLRPMNPIRSWQHRTFWTRWIIINRFSLSQSDSLDRFEIRALFFLFSLGVGITKHSSSFCTEIGQIRRGKQGLSWPTWNQSLFILRVHGFAKGWWDCDVELWLGWDWRWLHKFPLINWLSFINV
jgi:hypothetical protein